MAKRGKRILAQLEKVDRDRLYPFSEAMEVIKSTSSAKFDETVEISLNMGVDPRHADQNIRGAVALPHGTGKTVRVLVFAKGEKAKEAEAAGADFVGAEDLAEKIQGGWLDFDRVVACPDVMAVVGRLGRVLGPRGLMPNPKLGTVTFDVTKAVGEIKAGQASFRVEKKGAIIHSSVGKASFSVENLTENAQALIDRLKKVRPSSTKGSYMKRITLSTTMGPGVKVDPQTV